MGVERAVTRWYVQRQQLLTEIATLSAKIELSLGDPSEAEEEGLDAAELDAAKQQLARAQEKLHLLGPCPKPMMG